MLNCVNCALVVDNQLATGAYASALPATQGVPFSELGGIYNTTFSGWVSQGEIENSLLANGEGTQAIIYGMDETGTSGHVWNAVVQDGSINYLDGQIQSGGAGNFNSFPYLRYGITGKGN
jgi:filamentous hemagglutinin